MTLTTHAITGAALASLIPSHPIAAFGIGFVSHFALDAIPHLDYDVYSDSINPEKGGKFAINKTLMLDGLRIGTDAFLGIALAILFFSSYQNISLTILFGAFGGLFPDFLHFVYLRVPYEPFISIEKFHMWIHTCIKMKEQKMLGFVSQVAFIALVVLSFKYFW